MTQLMNYSVVNGGVCRTALATSGLFKSMYNVSFEAEHHVFVKPQYFSVKQDI